MGEKTDRRTYLKVVGGTVGGLVVGGAIGYLAKPSEAVEKTVTETQTATKTVTATAPTVTTTPAVAGDLRWADFKGDAPTVDYYDQAIAAFRAKFPKVNVSLEIIPWASWREKLVAAYAAEESPDGFQHNCWDYYEFIDRNLFVALDEMEPDNPLLNPDLYLPAAQRMMSYGDHVYGIPHESGVLLLIFNHWMLEEAGIDPHHFEFKDWDHFMEVAKATTVKENGKVVRPGWLPELLGRPLHELVTWGYANGVYPMIQDGEPQFDRPEMVEVLEFFLELKHEMGVAPVEDMGAVQTAFAAEGCAVCRWGTWCEGQLIAKNPRFKYNFGFLPVPKGPSGKEPAAQWFQNPLVISSQTKYKEAAWEWVKFLGDDEGMSLYFSVSERFSYARKEEYLPPAFEETFLIPEKDAYYWNREDTHGGKHIAFMNPQRYQVEEILTPLMGEVMLERKTPKEALTEANEKIGRLGITGTW